jgi:hypothetical protein
MRCCASELRLFQMCEGAPKQGIGRMVQHAFGSGTTMLAKHITGETHCCPKLSTAARTAFQALVVCVEVILQYS